MEQPARTVLLVCNVLSKSEAPWRTPAFGTDCFQACMFSMSQTVRVGMYRINVVNSQTLSRYVKPALMLTSSSANGMQRRVEIGARWKEKKDCN